MSSAKAVAIAKRFFNAKKTGHAGTLDPLACGVLPLGFGEATKVMRFLINATKEYRFTVQWGASTTTDDCEGDVVHISDVRPTQQQIERIIIEFIGEITQAPPAFSAIKVNGKRAYALARQGKDVALAPRTIHIHKLSLVDATTDSATFDVTCSKGTYIRSLGKDIAEKLGTQGHISFLQRTRVGPFSLNDAILLEKLEKPVYKVEVSEGLLPVEHVLDDIPVLCLTPQEAYKLRCGQHIKLPDGSHHTGEIITKCDDTLVAIAKAGEAMLKPVRIFNL